MQDRSNREVVVRLDAIRAWATHAIDGDCTTAEALDAIGQLTAAANGFLHLREAA